MKGEVCGLSTRATEQCLIVFDEIYKFTLTSISSRLSEVVGTINGVIRQSTLSFTPASFVFLKHSYFAGILVFGWIWSSE